ncbi:Cell surface protein [Bacillus mycoides]|nr:Cell surface protein [Bacillus mycoides]
MGSCGGTVSPVTFAVFLISFPAWPSHGIPLYATLYLSHLQTYRLLFLHQIHPCLCRLHLSLFSHLTVMCLGHITILLEMYPQWLDLARSVFLVRIVYVSSSPISVFVFCRFFTVLSDSMIGSCRIKKRSPLISLSFRKLQEIDLFLSTQIKCLSLFSYLFRYLDTNYK